jgi:hypothetical protein
MIKKVFAICGIALAAALAIMGAKTEAVTFAKKLKGTDIKATPLAQHEQPIMLAKRAQGDCF